MYSTLEVECINLLHLSIFFMTFICICPDSQSVIDATNAAKSTYLKSTSYEEIWIFILRIASLPL